jgi:2-polyprenyl-3-methyl-5-hydroxy-6-metoxy-1,4-benzoquinol methylase
MGSEMSREKSKWTPVTEAMRGGDSVAFGRPHSSWLQTTGRQALSHASYYKFAAKMIGKEKRVLDIGCGDGFGTWMLAKECGFAKGIDRKRDGIDLANKNWKADKIEFERADFLRLLPNAWDAVVSFDFKRHDPFEDLKTFFISAKRNLAHDGIVIVGAPCFENRKRASKVFTAKHARSYAGERLGREMSCHFGRVLMFSAHNEIVCAGVSNYANYLIAVGCRKKQTRSS